jgi:hypothetical protein
MAEKKETAPAVIPAYAPFPAPTVPEPKTEKAE